MRIALTSLIMFAKIDFFWFIIKLNSCTLYSIYIHDRKKTFKLTPVFAYTVRTIGASGSVSY